METSRECMRICILLLYLTAATISFTQCDARKSHRLLKGLTKPPPTHHRSLFLRTAKKLNLVKRIEYNPFGSSKQQNQEPYGLNSPLSLPPYDSLAPLSLPDANAPPFCTYPPNTPQTPSTTTPTPTTSSPPSPQSPYLYVPPILPMQSPPPVPIGTIPGPPQSISVPGPPESIPSPTIYFPGPPQSIPTPNPPETVPSPPYYEPSPPDFSIPSPPSFVPSPPYGFQPSPPVFEPPVVFPPPTTPPSPKKGPTTALWCVAKPSVPDPIIQEAMNYACGSGADCDAIQPNGSCFEPNTLFAHASFAFNSYFQRTRVAGGTCSFGGTAILVTVDPSYDGCRFDYY
ncbi:extensin [Rosa sericea]